jgi:DNA-binding Lrp family transcriptional regulator
MDKIDRKILNELSKNARASFVKIGEKVGLSSKEVRERVRKLEERGVIKHYAVLLDEEKVGYDLHAVIGVKIAKGRLIQVEKQISGYPNVIGVYDVTGEFDAIIVARFKNRRHLNNFVKLILRIPYVERSCTFVALNVIKQDPRIFFEEI